VSRCILVTGATGKIGSVFVRHFLTAGDTVVAVGRSADSLAQLVSHMSGVGGCLQTICVDLMEVNAIATVIDKSRKLVCMPDCIINNARNLDYLRIGKDGFIDRQDFLNEFELDVVAPYELIMGMANATDTRLRAVVNIGSQYGSVAPNLYLYEDSESQSPVQYSVAKAALAHLTKELAVRLASRGIRINCVAFGGVEGRVDDEFLQRYATLCPMGRMLGEQELPGPVDLLLSDSASGVTGHIMMVDGGWSVW
jgi:NAD(P)-dependent dehydrogenase (short-subunit alcohol dehydrogenase family)